MAQLARRLKLGVVLAIVICATLGGLAELALRWLRPPAEQQQKAGYDLSFVTHDGLPISTLDGPLKLCLSPFTIYKNLPNQRTATFSINSRGFRGPEPDPTHRRFRIVLIGGSTAFGKGADSDDSTFAARMQAENHEYEVLNAAVIGFHSGQELAYLVSELMDYHPDLVLACDGWNDFVDTYYGFDRKEELLGFNTNFFVIENQLHLGYLTIVNPGFGLRRAALALRARSRVLSYLSRVFLNLTQQPGATAPSEQRSLEFIDRISKNYVSNLSKMQHFCRSYGVRFLVAFQPEIGIKSKRTPHEEEAYSEGVGAVASYKKDQCSNLYGDFIKQAASAMRAEGIAYVDLSAESRLIDSQQELFADTVHLNNAGNDIVYQILLDHLSQLPRQ